jgi:hypothetical protein
VHAGLRTETSALRDVMGAMVGRIDQLVDCQNALQRQVSETELRSAHACSAADCRSVGRSCMCAWQKV